MSPKSSEAKQLPLPGLEKVPKQKFGVIGFIRSLAILSTLYSGLACGSVVLVSTLLSREDPSLISIAAVVPLIPAFCLSFLIEDKMAQEREKKSSRIAVFPEKK